MAKTKPKINRALLTELEQLRAACPTHRRDWRRTIDGYINRLKLYRVEPQAETVAELRRVITPKLD
jgi:hypothetical protein